MLTKSGGGGGWVESESFCLWVEPFPGAAYDLRHPQVLPFPAAVSAQSGHHPGERGEFKATHYLKAVVAYGENKLTPRVWLQFLACLVQLPPPMNTTDILWLSCFSCPLLRSTETHTHTH